MDKLYKIYKFIDNDDFSSLSTSLYDLNLLFLAKDLADKLLSDILTYTSKNLKIDAVRIIIPIFDIERLKVDPLPTLTNLFLNHHIDHDILIFTLECFPEKTPVDYLLDLINMGNDIEAVIVAQSICNIFTNFTNDEWYQLTKLTTNTENTEDEDDEYPNIQLHEFFIYKFNISNTSKDDFTIDDSKYKDIIDKYKLLPPVKNIVDLLYESVNNYASYKNTKDIETIKNILMVQYSMSSSLDKVELLKSLNIPAYNSLPTFDDGELSTILGQINTLYSPIDDDDNHPCFKYGGCRMMLCSHFEEFTPDGFKIDIFDDDDIKIDWFRGCCDECQTKILTKTKSFRIPLLYGGWKGCYCSVDCIKKQINYNKPHNKIMLDILNNLK